MFWTKDGKLITDGDGRPIDCPTCPCKTCEQSLASPSNIEYRAMQQRPTLSVVAYDPLSEESTYYSRGSGDIMVFCSSYYQPYYEAGIELVIATTYRKYFAYRHELTDAEMFGIDICTTNFAPAEQDETSGLYLRRGIHDYMEYMPPIDDCQSLKYLGTRPLTQVNFHDTISPSDARELIVQEFSALFGEAAHGAGTVLFYDDYRGGNRNPSRTNVIACALINIDNDFTDEHGVQCFYIPADNPFNYTHPSYFAQIIPLWSDQDRDLLVFE